MTGNKTLLISATVPLVREHGTLHLEDQACNGLRLWAENFSRLVVLMPLEAGPVPASWRPLEEVGSALERMEFLHLPIAYRPDQFFRHLPTTRRRIQAAIAQADYVGFAIGGLFGDWGSVGCLEAHRMGKPYYVWADRVESEVTRRMAGDGPWRQRLRARMTHRPMSWLERHVIRHATLGLFHGRETYEAFAPYCRAPELVHDIHIKRQDHISASALDEKIVAAAAGGPLKICYVGRADAMKGPIDWVEALAKLTRAGVSFEATWLGHGEKLEEMRQFLSREGLSGHVFTPGYTSDRDAVLSLLRDSHLFMFCHKTPESPRCLIEALASGCPIVGYEGAFARDLTAQHKGSVLVPMHDVDALADAVAGLAADRGSLADLIGRAAADGKPFTDVAVFRHRSDIIKRYLSS